MVDPATLPLNHLKRGQPSSRRSRTRTSGILGHSFWDNIGVARSQFEKELINRVSELEGVSIAEGAFAAGPAVWVGKREVAHFDADGAMDVRLTKPVIRKRRSELEEDNMISFRTSSSDWLEIRLHERNDIELAISLVKDAVDANLPTAIPGPRPTGQELARRRRFH
jgi:hypothetical protein